MEKETKTLSVVMSVYNEKDTILDILKIVENVELPGIKKEIILVDDCSTDGTRDILEKLKSGGKYKIFFKEKNGGKGSAIRQGFKIATGDYIIIQDADMEYNPNEYKDVLKPLIDGAADVVYGSRFLMPKPHRVAYFRHTIGNKFLTFLSNLFTNLYMTDMETCYKAFTKEALDKIKDKLISDRFGIEPEITARVAKSKARVYEVGISYTARTFEEGKKIGWKDGVSAMWCIVKFNLFGRG